MPLHQTQNFRLKMKKPGGVNPRAFLLGSMWINPS